MSLLLFFAGVESESSEGGNGSSSVESASTSAIGTLGSANLPYTPTFAINVHEPLAAGGRLRESAIIANSYSHVVSAIGGYISATFEIAANMNIINDWLTTGLMRHISVAEPAGNIVWEGFVNGVTLNFGRISIVRGPVLGIGNKVSCKYTTVRYDPLGINFGGKAAQTQFFEDDDMQDIYGIIETVITSGEMHEDDAEEIAKTYLAEFKYPETSHSVSFLGSNTPSVTVQCSGYSALFDKYYYSKTDTANEINLSVKLNRIVSADPNLYYTINDTTFKENTLQVIEYEDGEKTARGLIDDLIARGDANDTRYLWGVYNDRVFQYTPAPTTSDYAFTMSEGGGVILDKYGLRVNPWRVTPGQWLTVSDLSLGGHNLSTTDPRAIVSSIFIETLTYSMPYSLDITGGRISSLKQKLFRLGLGGM